MPNRTAVAVIVLGSSILLGAPLAMAQFSGTPKEQAACRPDVAKHCKGLTGDSDDVFVECLVNHASQLTAACRKVLESHKKLPPS